MRVNPATGEAWAGVGANQAWTWAVDQPAPVSVGPGAAGGWNGATYIGTSPRGPNFSPSSGPPWPTSLGFDAMAANKLVAAAGKWIAWNPASGSYGIGVPAGYEGWTPVGICDDGTVIMLLNGVYRVFWPNGNTLDLFDDVFVGADCVLTIAGGTLTIHHAGGSYVPAQRPGAKFFPTSMRDTAGAQWLFYSSGDQACAVCHRWDDAAQGYRVTDAPLTMLGPVSLCGITLADGRTELAWANGPDEQGPGILGRTFVVLGEGMQPFVTVPPVEPPIPPVDPPPIDPEPPIDPPVPPNPEPEPMPRPEPKDREDMEVQATRAYMDHVGGMSLTDARQGVRQTGDRIASHPGLYWDAYALAMGAPTRDGAPSVTIDAKKQDALAKDCEVINRECLQR